MTKSFFARISITFVNSSVGTSGRAPQKSTVTPAVDFCLYPAFWLTLAKVWADC